MWTPYEAPREEEAPNIRTWHKWACVLHTAQALVIMILIASGTIPHTAGIFGLTRQTTVWTPGSPNNAMVGNYTIARFVQLPLQLSLSSL